MPFYIYNRLHCEFWNEKRRRWYQCLSSATEYGSQQAASQVAKELPTAIGELLILEFRGVK